MSKQYTYYIFVFLFTLSSCDGNGSATSVVKEEANASTYKSLMGKWKLRSGIVANQKTDRLDGTTFEFMPDKQLMTNLPTINNGNFSLNAAGTEIEHRAENTVSYAISQLQDTTLQLTLNYRNNEFRLQFGRE